MTGLADVQSSCVAFAIRRMVTQRFHPQFGTFVDHDGVIIATRCLRTHTLEFVEASVCAVLASQFPLKWIVFLIFRRQHTHDVLITTGGWLPGMRVSVRAQRFVPSAVLSSIRTKMFRKFLFEFVPPGREIRIFIEMWQKRNVISLTNINNISIVFTITWVIAQWFHVHFGTFRDHQFVIIASNFLGPDFLELVDTFFISVFLTQFPLEWIILHVWWRASAHEFAVRLYCLPSMAATISSAQCIDSAI